MKTPRKKFEYDATEAAKVELDQTLPCTSESHPHPPIGPLTWAVGVTGGEPQNFADSITVVLVPLVGYIANPRGPGGHLGRIMAGGEVLARSRVAVDAAGTSLRCRGRRRGEGVFVVLTQSQCH